MKKFSHCLIWTIFPDNLFPLLSHDLGARSKVATREWIFAAWVWLWLPQSLSKRSFSPPDRSLCDIKYQETFQADCEFVRENCDIHEWAFFPTFTNSRLINFLAQFSIFFLHFSRDPRYMYHQVYCGLEWIFFLQILTVMKYNFTMCFRSWCKKILKHFHL